MWWRFAKAVKSGAHKVAPMTWITAIGAVVYTFVPVDIIPELFFGPFGLVDDAGVWVILFTLLTREKQRFEARVNASVVDAENFRVD